MNHHRGYTPNQLKARYGVGVHKILNWIKNGTLAAVNVASNPHGRPQFVIMPEAVADFERRRSAQPKAPAPRRRKKKTDVIEFF